MKFTPDFALRLALFLLFTLTLSSCGPTSAPIAAPVIDFGKHRDLAGLVEAVLVESAVGASFDESEVDSPSVVLDPARAGGDRYMLFYEGTDAVGMPSIGLVTSAEPEFTSPVIDRDLLFAPTLTTLWEFGAADPTVIVDKRASENPDIPSALTPSKRYKMWFEALSGPMGGISTIVYSEFVDDGTTAGWSTPVAVTGLDDALASVSFDAVRIVDPAVVFENPTGNASDRFLMWFEAVRSDGSSVIGFADSLDGKAWTVRDGAGQSGVLAAPLLLPRTGTIDGGGLSSPGAALEKDADGNVLRYHLWYEAQLDLGTSDTTIGYARSTDLQFWERFSLAVLEPSSDSIVPLPFDSDDLKHPTALLVDAPDPGDDGPFLLWYAADEEDVGNTGVSTPNRIGYAHGN